MLSFLHVVPLPGVRGVVGEPWCRHPVLLRGSVRGVLRKAQKLYHSPRQSHTDTVLCNNFHGGQ